MTQPAAFLFDPETHRYTLNGVALPGITQILKLTGFVDGSWFTDEARDRGKAVHSACWFLAEGDLDWSTVGPDILPRVKAFEQFLNDYTPKLIMAERPLYSAMFGFAGTEDFFFEIPGLGGECIIEVKTGRAGLAAKLQTAAQRILIEENQGIKKANRFGFELSKEGRYKFVPHTDGTDKVMFLNAVAMIHRRINEGELKI